MVRTVAAKTRKALVRAAQHSAEKIRRVAADAASAATQAAAGVVLWRHGRAAGKTPMPYAPFLAAGAVIALLVGTSSPILH